MDGIYICSQENIFSAHNLKIFISQNTIKKNGMCGIRIQDLVLNDMQIMHNEVNRNESAGIILQQIHQKSNKFKFLMQANNVSDTTNGSGIILRDVGIHILSCKIERNNDDGILIDSS